MNKELNNKYIILQFTSYWEYRDFSLGLNLCSQSMDIYREYYLLICLGFWQLSVGVKIHRKDITAWD